MSNNTATSTIKGSRSIERFVFDYTINTTTNEITVNASINGINLGTSNLNPENSNQDFGQNTEVLEFSGTVSANYETSELHCTTEIKEYGKVVYQGKGTIATW
ncbi:hypothetical protein SAMN04489761_4227 [Tenacibaculum sp. MAR_2009_124]|uniref:hypothetical protein n=1 Tax=Tenacibaculum sp. MAR_2009_124 TaxID=1250059 RepID=UPI000899A1E8|nr:hypothetical protein [Tenacibaculum sp. MAR_2009_124]SED08621.1 hypothetical protein SAMN04489761_4227 [Tenacibaculum sp. MAR_2009_124]